MPSYREYTDASVSAALAAIRSGMLSLRKAASAYNLPPSTLSDKINGKTPEISKSGPPPILTSAEESVLGDYITLMSSIGYPLTKKLLMLEVKKILDKEGRSTPFPDNIPGTSQ